MIRCFIFPIKRLTNEVSGVLLLLIMIEPGLVRGVVLLSFALYR